MMRITQERVNNICIWDYMAGLVGRPDPLSDALIQDERQRIVNIRAAAQRQEDMENARTSQNVV